jgi:hypothetical protein
MKKLSALLLFSALLLAGFAQPRRGSDVKLPFHPVPVPTAVSPDESGLGVINFFPGQTDYHYYTPIGNTYYDSQTFNSGNLMNRVYSYPDGTIGASWMNIGPNGTPDRGTAYNYFDGNQWGTANPHLGTATRTGFPSYAPWGPNGEIVANYQYIANDGPIVFLRRENKGQGDWIESKLQPPAGNHSLVWHSMVTSGANHEFIHVLALVYDDPYQGQDDALLYYRSSDGGVTWDINGMQIEGLGSAYYPSIPGLKYSWAQPVGNTIAFTFGFDEFDGLVFKSNDNGTTWQKTVVYDSPVDPMNVPADVNVYGCGDGNSVLTLDDQGKAHVVFGRMLRLREAGSWYYIPLASEGVIYWNEDMPALDSTSVSSYTLDHLIAGGNLIGWITGNVSIANSQPDYGVGLTSQAQISRNDAGELSVVYSAVSPENMINDLYYRHLYFVRSSDGGATWTDPYPLNSDIDFSFSECVYPALAPHYNSKIEVLFQEDYAPGTGTGAGLGEENYMQFLTLVLFTTGNKPDVETTGFEVSQNYPNPACGSTQICVKLDQAVAVRVSLTDISGRVIRVQDAGTLNPGQNYLTLGLPDLKPGVYAYTVQAGNRKISRKLILQ